MQDAGIDAFDNEGGQGNLEWYVLKEPTSGHFACCRNGIQQRPVLTQVP